MLEENTLHTRDMVYPKRDRRADTDLAGSGQREQQPSILPHLLMASCFPSFLS